MGKSDIFSRLHFERADELDTGLPLSSLRVTQAAIVAIKPMVGQGASKPLSALCRLLFFIKRPANEPMTREGVFHCSADSTTSSTRTT